MKTYDGMQIIKSDKQRFVVYDWEREFISHRDTTIVPFNQIKTIVDYVWKMEGLNYPPLVERLHKNSKYGGDATRTKVRFQETTYTWIILHELSHSMATDVLEGSNLHGSLFLGIYMQLLNRYMGIPLGYLYDTATARGLVFKKDVRPVFLV